MGAVKLSEKFSLQFDETTDIGNDAQLMVFVRHRANEDYLENGIISFLPSTYKNTTREEIFNNVDSFFKEHQLSWTDFVSVCANSAASMMGTIKGFLSFVKEEKRHFSYSLSSPPRKSGSKRVSQRPRHNLQRGCIYG